MKHEHGPFEPTTCHPTPSEPIYINRSLSFASSIMQSLVEEQPLQHMDLAPTDAMSKEEHELAYDLFYGTSPLNSPMPSPTSLPSPSWPTSPECGSSGLASAQKLLPPHTDAQSSSSRPKLPVPVNVPLAPCQSSLSPPSPLPPKSEASTLPQQPVAATGNSKMRRNKKKSHVNRHLSRKDVRNNESPTVPEARLASVLKHIWPSKKVKTEYSATDMPVASTGFIALPDKGGKVCGLDELLRRGFRLICNDGNKSRPIVDKNNLVIAVIVSAPDSSEWPDASDNSDWSEVIRTAYNELEASAPYYTFPKKPSRQGRFPALNAGISFRGGHERVGNIYQRGANKTEIERLLKSQAFICIAGFASGAFATWVPKLHVYYKNHLNNLLASDPNLRRNFKNSTWAAAAFNFGPWVVTARHRDFANLPFGLCGITALGDYDPTKWGHVILWELQLIIELLPGSTILLPSASISHSNMPIGKGEKRALFTQFSAGGLFRWVEHGFQKKGHFEEGMSAEQELEVLEENNEQCKLALSLFSTLDKL